MNTSSPITQKLKLQNIPIGPSTGDDMGVCEVCGAEKVGTRSARRGRTVIDACLKCIDKMGLEVNTAPTPRRPVGSQRRSPARQTSGGYGGKGQKGKDIMVRNARILRSDFASAIREPAKALAWMRQPPCAPLGLSGLLMWSQKGLPSKGPLQSTFGTAIHHR